MRPVFGAMVMSGGSPASRERAMRSWVMLIASIITAEMPGAPSLRPKICRCKRCRAARPLLPGSRASSIGMAGSAKFAWSWITPPLLKVAAEIDGDDDAGAERPAHRHRKGD